MDWRFLLKLRITVTLEYELKWVDGLNSGNVSVANELFHSDSVIHINGNPQRDLSIDNFKQMLAGLFAAFPDLHFRINDQFNSEKKLAPGGLLKEQIHDLSVICKPQAVQLKSKGLLFTMQ